MPFIKHPFVYGKQAFHGCWLPSRSLETNKPYLCHVTHPVPHHRIVPFPVTSGERGMIHDGARQRPGWQGVVGHGSDNSAARSENSVFLRTPRIRLNNPPVPLPFSVPLPAAWRSGVRSFPVWHRQGGQSAQQHRHFPQKLILRGKQGCLFNRPEPQCTPIIHGQFQPSVWTAGMKQCLDHLLIFEPRGGAGREGLGHWIRPCRFRS